MKPPTITQELLNYVCNKSLPLQDYQEYVSLLPERWIITDRLTGQAATQELVDRMIRWEKDTNDQHSLETVLGELFIIQRKPSSLSVEASGLLVSDSTHDIKKVMDGFCSLYQNLILNNKPMQELTREGFWDPITGLFPDQMKRFCDYVDQYKKRVDWNLLFNSRSEYQNAIEKNAPAPKYHDLPIAMQVGIFLQYCIEEKHRYPFLEDQPRTMIDFAIRIIIWMRQQESFDASSIEQMHDDHIE